MFGIGPQELILIMVIALLVVGPKRLPEVGRTIGKSLREFRKAQEDLKDSFSFDLDDSKPAPLANQPAPAPEIQPAPDIGRAGTEEPDRDEAE